MLAINDSSLVGARAGLHTATVLEESKGFFVVEGLDCLGKNGSVRGLWPVEIRVLFCNVGVAATVSVGVPTD